VDDLRRFLRAGRWLLLVAGLVVVWRGGASVFGQPAREIVYQPEAPLVTCHSRGCLFLYTLEVGNTGREPQEEVVVRLRAPALAGAALPPRARDFGKLDRPVRITEAAGVRAYALGALAPQARVELGFALTGPTREAAPGWAALLAGVEAPGAPVRTGSPGWLMLLRVYYAVFRLG
jgi:hypothetical protein